MANDLYGSFGGREFSQKLSTEFYARVARDPLLRPLFPTTFRCAIEQFAAFLSQFLSGPPEDTQQRWWLSIQASHQRFPIGAPERDAWLRVMNETLEQVEMPERCRQSLRELFKVSSAYIARQPESSAIEDPQIRLRWEVQVALEQAVARIHVGDFDQALASAQAPPLKEFFTRDRAVHAHFLALLIRSGGALEHVDSEVKADPELAAVRHTFNRTLLHEAGASGRAGLTQRLLRLGADPNAGTHSPLYSVANECQNDREGARTVRILAAAGADVNARDPKQQTTPLHMAARRGSPLIAEALIECGAHIDPRDSTGDTPLRRAINCRRPDVARLLLAHGANPDSLGSKQLTPRTAARDAKMRAVFLPDARGI
ncbi:MAG TPA: ankyrin repeat domain-containing protein [Bryobacteraceae bacterium]